MATKNNRTVVGLTALVVVWIVAYWLWPSRGEREPRVSFAREPEAAQPETIEPVVQAESDKVVPRVGEPEQLLPDDSESVQGEEGTDDAGPFGPPPFRWVVARSGDTFEKIAAREFGSRSLWTAIARANPLKDPNRLKPGDRVKVPLNPDNPQGRPLEASQDEPAAPEPVVEYTVQPNDTLSGIAKQFYGSVRFVDFLYEANRDRLRSKDALRVGQVLRIPPKPSDGG